MSSDPYDTVPYHGGAVWGAHPERLALAAILSGLEPARPSRCRYLELACGPGGNLVPLAYHLDGSRFVGVERARTHYEMATERRDRLGLDNLELVHADLLDLDPALGEFDYIVAHGVFSWVPRAVRQRILELCARHLAPQGVAYISYNALPGWGVRGQIRRVLRRTVRGVDDPKQQLALARERLSLLRAAVATRTDPHGLVARNELDLARAQEDWLLFHDYLAPINVPFSASRFIDLAGRHGLAYVAELVPAFEQPATERELDAQLEASIEDLSERELAKDALSFRQFRATLLARRDALATARPARPHPSMRFATTLSPKSGEAALGTGEPLVLVDGPTGTEVTATTPLLQSALLELAEARPSALRLPELADLAFARLVLARARPPEARPTAEEIASIGDALLTLRARGQVEVHLSDPPQPTRSHLQVSPLTRVEAASGPWLTTPSHASVRVDEPTRILVRLLDGSHELPELVECLLSAIQRGELPMRSEGDAETDEASLRQVLPRVVERSLATLSDNDLLRV